MTSDENEIENLKAKILRLEERLSQVENMIIEHEKKQGPGVHGMKISF